MSSSKMCDVAIYLSVLCVFFFSSRRRHTRYWRDWSSDVCSSDLRGMVWEPGRDDASLHARRGGRAPRRCDRPAGVVLAYPSHALHARRLYAARNLQPAQEAADRSTREAERRRQRAVLSGGRRPVLWPYNRTSRPRPVLASVVERLPATNRREAFQS